MAIEISVTRNIKAPREFVFDWWTDLQPEDSKLVRPLKSRRIVSRSADKIKLHDSEQMYLKQMEFDVEVALQRPNSWIAEYHGRVANARSVYNLKSESDGTTNLNYSTKIKPEGFFTKLFTPLIKPFVKKVFVGEIDVFIRTLEKEYVIMTEQKKSS
jgi:carbon monoxide dehydrogenase subunit G